ncbi:MAG: N-acetylneuraminate synthase family protein [Desulfobacteraceae bacterium]|jgi:sialic acid synthase SpsE/spore coat polysaccharide biosynthesis protein SpsF (cytidylyltransferase family)|nr:N-acetylneuraminate synthase family protein [Desulfobacteraceae bacterium]
MKTGIVILCRYASNRLPGKILKEIKGRSVLGHIYDRIQRGAHNYPVVVATSLDHSDDPIVRYCQRSMLECFRGSLENVAKRLLDCAEKKSWDFVVRINGDNLFADPDLLNSMLAIAETNEYDFITNVPGRTFPYGMSIEIVRVSFFRRVLGKIQNLEHCEHVTSWLYENEQVGRRYVLKNKHCPEAKGLHLALDTEDDLVRHTSLFERMDNPPATYRLAEIVRLATQPEQLSPWLGKFGPLLIAEIGGNHEGNFEAAKKLVEKAIATGVDYVKFQLYRGDTLVSPVESPDRNRHFKNFELTRKQHIELAQMCQHGGVGYLASVWDLEMLDWIDPYLSVYKIGSGDLTAWPVIREFARRKKPIILSTGLATLDEVLQAVAQIQAIDERYRYPEWLCLLQCTAMYPITDEEANLRVMDTFKDTTGLAVGYSDHTEKDLALRTAAAMGAEVLEFHFTDSREGKVFRDHKVSLTPEEVLQLQHDLLKIKNFRGENIKIPQPTEVEQGHIGSFRRGIYLRRIVERDERIGKEDLVALRPNLGIDARDSDQLIGSRARKKLMPYYQLSWDDIYTNFIGGNLAKDK